MVGLPQRRLGVTDLVVSRLSLGTVKFGRNEGVRYPRHFELPSDRQLDALLGLAGDLGVNLLDTAPAYGDSESRLGRLLEGRHDHFLVSTKVGEEFADGHSTFDFSPAHTRRSVERSLRRLRRETLDLVLVHSDGRDEEIARESGVLETLLKLEKEGLIRAFGMSTKTLPGARLSLGCTGLAMVTWNLDDDSHAEVLEEARQAGHGILIKKALASGHTGNTERALTTLFQRFDPSTVVVGTLNPDHLRQNVRAVRRALHTDPSPNGGSGLSTIRAPGPSEA